MVEISEREGEEEMKRPYQFTAQCLVCEHKGKVLYNSKEEYQEVTVCPKCNGAFVDVYRAFKYVKGIQTSLTDKPDVPVVEKKQCSDLTERQIEILRRFIENHDKYNMSICSCDVTRVLALSDDSLPTHLKGSD